MIALVYINANDTVDVRHDDQEEKWNEKKQQQKNVNDFINSFAEQAPYRYFIYFVIIDILRNKYLARLLGVVLFFTTSTPLPLTKKKYRFEQANEWNWMRMLEGKEKMWICCCWLINLLVQYYIEKEKKGETMAM